MNLKIATILVPELQNKRYGRKAYYDFKTISCRANDQLSMKKNNMTNFYEVLLLGSENVGHGEIKKAYRNLALQCHPDVCPPSAKEESTKRFVEQFRRLTRQFLIQFHARCTITNWVWSSRRGLELREKFIEKKASPDFPRKYGKSSSLV